VDCCQCCSVCAMVCDLAGRLASRGMRPPAVDDIGRVCGPDGPVKLKEESGSEQVRGQMQSFLAAVLRGRTVSELREVCLLAGLQTCGAKADLVKRLAFQRGTEPSTPKKQVQRRRSSGAVQPNNYSEVAAMSPERLTPPHQSRKENACCVSPDCSESSYAGFGPVKKVSQRRRSVGSPPSNWDVAQSKLVDSPASLPKVPESCLQTMNKRRRMSI